MNYRETDKMISYINKWLIRRFSRLKSILSIDEINVIEEINTLYQELYVSIRQRLLRLANKVYHEISQKGSDKQLDEQWLDEILDGYDPVSKYVFSHEEDRKRARLIEAVIASSTKEKEIDAALRGMAFMYRIYAVRVTDEAVLQAYKDDGEDMVKWIAEKDEKTCSVCHKRDGKIYEIDFLPPKPHPNCRCRFVQVTV